MFLEIAKNFPIQTFNGHYYALNAGLDWVHHLPCPHNVRCQKRFFQLNWTVLSDCFNLVRYHHHLYELVIHQRRCSDVILAQGLWEHKLMTIFINLSILENQPINKSSAIMQSIYYSPLYPFVYQYLSRSTHRNI